MCSFLRQLRRLNRSEAVFKFVHFWPVKLTNEAYHEPNRIPNSSKAHRLGTGIFHPVLMEILKRKVEKSTRTKNSDSYSPYSHKDVFEAQYTQRPQRRRMHRVLRGKQALQQTQAATKTTRHSGCEQRGQ